MRHKQGSPDNRLEVVDWLFIRASPEAQSDNLRLYEYRVAPIYFTFKSE